MSRRGHRRQVIVVGVDPGSIRGGYGMIRSAGQRLHYLGCGLISAPAWWPSSVGSPRTATASRRPRVRRPSSASFASPATGVEPDTSRARWPWRAPAGWAPFVHCRQFRGRRDRMEVVLILQDLGDMNDGVPSIGTARLCRCHPLRPRRRPRGRLLLWAPSVNVRVRRAPLHV